MACVAATIDKGAVKQTLRESCRYGTEAKNRSEVRWEQPKKSHPYVFGNALENQES